jgi:hypothetical protein
MEEANMKKFDNRFKRKGKRWMKARNRINEKKTENYKLQYKEMQ